MMYGSVVPWRRNVFLDCGGNNGCSVRKFRKDIDIRRRFFIYSFEPNELYKKMYDGYEKHQLIEAAVHDRDGFSEFYLDREDGDGSSLYKNKLTRENGGYGTLDVEAPQQVKTINLSKWICDNLARSDYIVLKLDIEGAEYDVLEKMDADGTLSRIRRLFIEWHWHKVGIEKSRHDRVLRILENRRIPVVEWDAQGF